MSTDLLIKIIKIAQMFSKFMDTQNLNQEGSKHKNFTTNKFRDQPYRQIEYDDNVIYSERESDNQIWRDIRYF